MESTAADIAGIADGLAKAQHAAVQADDAAQRIASWAAGSGFAGIAQNVSRLRAAVREVHDGIAAVSGLVAEASTAAATARAQATPQQTITFLDLVTQTLTDIHRRLGVMMERLAKARQLADAVLQGGQPGPMLARLDAIRQILLAVVQRTNQAEQNVRIAVSEARKIGDQQELSAGAAGPSEGSPPPGSRLGADPMAPVTPGWTRVDAGDAPPHVRQAAADFEPRISGHPRKTTAIYNGRTLVSGGRQTELADDLAYERIPRPGGRPYPRAPNVLYEHPEMKVAAEMRQQGVPAAEMVVDNSMCGTREFDQSYPLNCDKLLPGAMPAGSRLTVWATIDGGRTFYRTVVTGTGSLIGP